MAKLHSLFLSGIRNFAPADDEKQLIKFSSPLTLILGQNGCGKTTIIEALRFGCTGELPEGSQKGQGFVHDPKISGQYTSKGQVRLKIHDGAGDEYIISKTVQVIQKYNTMAFSRPDSTLKYKGKGISGRCADVDAHCKEVMGVSAPILNNVIFCHQENSCWPLEEGQKLKKKFDEIFEATKYNKLIDNGRKSIKVKREQLKVFRVELEARKEKKEEVERQRNRVHEDEERLVDIEHVIDEKKAQLAPILAQVNEILALEMRLSELRKELAVKEQAKESLMQQEAIILRNIVSEFAGTDEELRCELGSFEEKAAQLADRLKGLEKRKLELDANEKNISADIPVLHVKIGQLNKEREHHKNYCAQREILLEKTKQNLNVSLTFDYKSASSITDGIRELQNALETSKSAVRDVENDFEAKESAQQRLIDNLNKTLTETRQSLQIKGEHVRENDKKWRDLNVKLSEVKFSDEKLRNLKQQIERLDKDLQSLKSNTDEANLEASIVSEERRVSALADEREALETEHRLLQRNDVLQAEIVSQQESGQKCRANAMRLAAKHFDDFQCLFGDAVPTADVKGAVEGVLRVEEERYERILRDVTAKERKLDEFKFELAAETKKLGVQTAEHDEIRSEISGLCGNDPYESVLERTGRELEQLQKDKGQLSAAKIIYEKFVNDFEREKPCCPLCKTDFAEKRLVAAEIAKTIRQKIRGIPDELKTKIEKLGECQKRHSELVQLKPKSDHMRLLANHKIPETNRRIADLQSSIDIVTVEIKALRVEIADPKKKRDVCRKVVADAAVIDENTLTEKRSDERVEDLRSQLITVASNRSKRETEARIEVTKEDLRRVQQNCDSLKRKLDSFKKACNEYSENRNKLFERQLELQKIMQSKPQLEEQLEALQKENECLRNETEDLKMVIEPMNAEVNEAKRRKDELKREHSHVLEDERRKLSEKTETLNEINRLQTTIKGYVTKNLEEQLRQANTELEEHQRNLDTLNKSKEKVVKTISEVKLQTAKQDEMFKSLRSNVELREKRVERNKIVAQIQSLREKVGDYDIQSIDKEKQTLLRRRELINADVSLHAGKKAELKSKIEEIKADLNRPDKREAFARFKEKMYEVHVQQAIIHDLDLYFKVMEDKIIEFHKSRMVEINRTIRDLWCSIYRGNDIDYIEIRTEAGKQTTAKRVYNYKVVQIKNGVELDMRGRCSAGQKVLTCLIIRMALAEAFAGNCGILALDEPTTNLDRENISSLSMALAAIVNDRREERNFQLLVITHDEEFLEELKQVESMSHYWRVSRKQNGCSTISKVEI